jgi:TPR repeat protein
MEAAMGVRIKLALTLLGAIIFAIAVVNIAAAGSYEEAMAAYERGDYVTAMRLLRPLAEQDNAYAQYKLGEMYDFGRGVPQNYAEAMKRYRKAAEQGNADAQDMLGIMYGLGLGVPQVP